MLYICMVKHIIIQQMSKQCIICEISYEVPENHFHKRVGSSDGLRSDCKACRVAKKKRQYKPLENRVCTKCHIEKPNTREFYYIKSNYLRQRTRSCCIACHKLYWGDQARIREYGVTPDIFHYLVGVQDGKCQICNLDKGKLVVDHDHKTGKVRALLCDQCNHALGSFYDNPEFLEKAALYIKYHNITT